MKIKKPLLAVIDGLIFILLIPVVLLYASYNFLSRCASRKAGIGSLLHISAGSSTQDVLNKFGSMDFFFAYDGNAAKGLFEREIMFWFPSKNSLTLYFNNGWIICEQRKALGLLPLTGLCLFYLRSMRLVAAERVKAIRGWDPYFSGFSAWALSLVFRVPFCVSIHSDYDKRYELDHVKGAPLILGSRTNAKRLERFVLSKADIIMPIRDHLGRSMVKNGADAGKIRVIPHGIDMTPFRKPPTADVYSLFDLHRNIKIVSFVGRLSKENYVDNIIEMTKLLRAKRNDFVVVMAGGGNEEGRLIEQISRDADLSEIIRLVGFQPQGVCFDLRRASVASLCLMGGFSLIEACAAGKPVIAYDVEWHDELVIDGKTGCLVVENDINALADAVGFFLDNPKEVERMGENARALAFERHDLSHAAQIKTKWYEELLKD